MSTLEQLALGWQCPLRALRESARWPLWRPWWPLLASYAAALLALSFAAHPALSWLMAPIVRMAAGDNALRYPELFHRLPGLWKWAQLALDALMTPFAAGFAATLWSERFRGAPLRPAQAWSEALRRWLFLLLATLPVTLSAVAGHIALDSLVHVRLSGISRALAPQALSAFMFFVRAACFYAVPMVMLDRRGARRALLAIPGTLKLGLLPALAATALLALAQWPVQMLLARGAALAERWPESVLGVALLSAVLSVALASIASGAGTLLYMSALQPDEDQE